MNKEKCEQCRKMLNSESTQRHDGLECNGRSKAVGHHGNRDDEYEYTCRNCGAQYTGDSCGTWERGEE